MGEILISEGDSVSKLLQVLAKEMGVKRIWTGDGRQDARAVMADFHNVTQLKDELWKGIRELYEMPELRELPERVQAKLMSIILARRANAELKAKGYAAPVKP